MKLRNTIFLALVLSAAPVSQSSAGFFTNTSTPPSFFSLSQKTHNFLGNVGIGIGIAALCYLWYWANRPLTPQEKAQQELTNVTNKIAAISQIPLIAKLTEPIAPPTKLQYVYSDSTVLLRQQIEYLIAAGTTPHTQWANNEYGFPLKARETYSDFGTISGMKISGETPWLLYGVAILQDTLGQIHNHGLKLAGLKATLQNEAYWTNKIDVVSQKITTLQEKLEPILNQVKNSGEYTAMQPEYDRLLSGIKRGEEEERANRAAAESERVQRETQLEIARIAAQAKVDAAKEAAKIVASQRSPNVTTNTATVVITPEKTNPLRN